MTKKQVMIIVLGILMLVITLVSVLGQVEILDPSGDIKREVITDKITTTINIDGVPIDCWYNLVVNDTHFDCVKGLNEFDISVEYFGANRLDVFVKDSSGAVYTDSLDFDVISSGPAQLKETTGEPVNLDNFLCTNGTCLWDDTSFVDYMLFVLVVGIVMITYFEMGDKKK